MRLTGKIVLVLGILVSGATPAGSTSGGDWEPSEFTFSKEPARLAIEQLQRDGDRALADVMAANPGFAAAFPTILAKFTAVAMQSISVPLGGSEADGIEDTSGIFGKTLKNLQTFALHMSVQLTAPCKTNDELLSYRYCEWHPKSSHYLCLPHPHYLDESNNWRAARRIISSDGFRSLGLSLGKKLYPMGLAMEGHVQGI